MSVLAATPAQSVQKTSPDADLVSRDLPSPSQVLSTVRQSIMKNASTTTEANERPGDDLKTLRTPVTRVSEEKQKEARLESAEKAGIITPEKAKELSAKQLSELEYLPIVTRDKLLQKAEEMGLITDAKKHPLGNEASLAKVDAANKELSKMIEAEEQFREFTGRHKQDIPSDALEKIQGIQDPVTRNKALDPYRQFLREVEPEMKSIPVEGTTATVVG